MISGHAINYSLPIVYANQVGGQDELVFDGTSMAMDGEGQQILQLEKFKEDYKIVNFTSDQEEVNYQVKERKYQKIKN